MTLFTEPSQLTAKSSSIHQSCLFQEAVVHIRKFEANGSPDASYGSLIANATIHALSFSLTTFSPSGKLVQIEHALAAVSAGTTSLGIKGQSQMPLWPTRKMSLISFRASPCAATNGVVIATEKKAPSLLVDDSMIEKVAVICPNIGFVYSGMGPDFRVLVTKARKIAQSYWKVYGEYPPTKVLVADIAGVMQKATQSG